MQYSRADRKWYDCYVCKLGGENSRQVAIIFQDITERKQAEASLKANLEDIAVRKDVRTLAHLVIRLLQSLEH